MAGEGKTLRDEFAMAADPRGLMDAMSDKTKEGIAGPAPDWNGAPMARLRWRAKVEARVRYELADAMMAERVADQSVSAATLAKECSSAVMGREGLFRGDLAAEPIRVGPPPGDEA